jgi:dTDP-4-dehydrorhamnose reductase
MLGSEVETLLRRSGREFVATDLDCDITDPQALAAFANGTSVHWIVNCSAYTAVDKAEDEPEPAYAINETGVRNLAAIARNIGAGLIHVSTDYVFDGTKDGPYTEDDRPHPIGVYGKSKLAGEEAVRRTLDSHYIVRTAWLYGKNGPNFVNTMLRLFRERDEVRVVADQTGSPTYARDLAAAILAFLNAGEAAPFGTYHFSNEGTTTWHAFASHIAERSLALGLQERDPVVAPISSAEYPTKAHRPANSLLDKTKIKGALGLTVRPWEDALEQYLTEDVDNA